MKRIFIIVLFLCGLGWVSACTQGTRSNLGATVPQTTVMPLDPDNEADALRYDRLQQDFGALSKASHAYQIGVVLKYLGNQYWQLLAEGVQSKADALDVTIDIRAAATETDPAGQRQIMEAMLDNEYDAFIISPQTDDNLIDVVEQAHRTGKIVLVVNEIVKDARHWVGPNQYESGVLAAEYFRTEMLADEKVAVIEGLPSAYAARQRTQGFLDTLSDTHLNVVASVPGNWDSQQARKAAATILQAHNDLGGFYCNNDVMAMGVIEAAIEADKLGDIMIIGTDGISPAYQAIRMGDLTATVDSFPYITGQVALEVVVRLLEGQALPRVVYSPQNLVTLSNIDMPMQE